MIKVYNKSLLCCVQVDQFPFLQGEDCKPGLKGEDWPAPNPQVRRWLLLALWPCIQGKDNIHPFLN